MEKILIVDDNKYIRFALSNLLNDAGYSTFSVGDGEKALKDAETKKPDLVLLDIKLPGTNGMKILEELKKVAPPITVVILTAYGNVKQAVQAMKIGAYDYITKPFDNDEMLIVIKKALNAKHLSEEVENLKKKLDEKNLPLDLIGRSEAMKKIVAQIDVVAPTNMTVVIEGESGTGKEVMANLIHKRSLRKDKPMIAIDCGAIPDTLIESELFGYERGAFTGADSKKEGKFEHANGGTLFLDEITNLSDSNQVKLLRVIEEKKLTRLGGKKTFEIDVRIIAATNLKLSEVVREGKLRSDLYYRINEFQIALPPLRERKEDIPLLVTHFLKEANSELNRNVRGTSNSALKELMNYSWPGNIRELKNIIRRAVLTSDSENIASIPFSDEKQSFKEITRTTEILDENSTFSNYTKQYEKDIIIKALKESNGNKSKAAKILKMNERTLYRKIKSLGL